MNHHLIVGLGNPGSKYSKTRHNVGWMILDSLLEDESCSWTRDKNSEYSKRLIDGNSFHFIKPQEFMNLSGKETARFAKLFKIPTDSILVVHDEIDLPFGKIKNKIGGGTAGHNGLGDIVEKLGDNGFHRIRFGVGRPIDSGISVADYVLQNFTEEELSRIQPLMEESKKRIREWIQARCKIRT